MGAFIHSLLRRCGIFTYLLFLGYLAYVHPRLIKRLSGTGGGQIDAVLGWFLLALLFLELLGFWLKHPIMVYYARQHPASDKTTGKSLGWVNDSGCSISLLVVIFLPILHLGMAFFLYMIATQIGGLDPGGSAPVWQQLLYVAGFFIVMIKETGMIGLFFSPYGIRGSSNNTYPTLGWRGLTQGEYPSKIQLEHLLRDILGDIILLAFSAIAYTVLWDFMGLNSPVYTSRGFWGNFFQYLGLGFYFLIVIPPLQSVYLFQAVTTRQTKAQRIWTGVGFLLIILVAVLSFPRV